MKVECNALLWLWQQSKEDYRAGILLRCGKFLILGSVCMKGKNWLFRKYLKNISVAVATEKLVVFWQFLPLPENYQKNAIVVMGTLDLIFWKIARFSYTWLMLRSRFSRAVQYTVSPFFITTYKRQRIYFLASYERLRSLFFIPNYKRLWTHFSTLMKDYGTFFIPCFLT